MLRSALLVTVALAMALGLGAGSVWLLATRPAAAPSGVGWLLSDAGPSFYARLDGGSRFALTLDPAEGASFRLFRSADGAVLDGRCAYRIEGSMPPARFWALATDGPAPDDSAVTSFLASSAVLTQPDDAVALTVSRHPAVGNWLALASTAEFSLALTLFDTPLTGVTLTDATLPRVVKIGCDG